MKRLAAAAAIFAALALPTVVSGLSFAQTVPAGTIDVECAEWRFDSDPTFGVSFPGSGSIFPPIGKTTNADIVRALGHVEEAVLEVEAAIEGMEIQAASSATCVEWQEFVAH